MAKKASAQKKKESKKKTVPSSKVSSKKDTIKKEVTQFNFKDPTKTEKLSEKIEFCEHNIGELSRYSNALVDNITLDAPKKEIVEVVAQLTLVDRKMMRTATVLGGFRQAEADVLKARQEKELNDSKVPEVNSVKEVEPKSEINQ